MRKNIILIVVVVLALIFGRMIVSKVNKVNSEKARAGSNIPAVTVAEVTTQNLIRQFEAPARVVAKYRVEVLARISGYLTKSYFKEGDYVKAGQILFEIEPQQYEFAVNQAKANLDDATAQTDYYEKQLARYEELVKQDYVAKSDYDNILAQKSAYDAQKDAAISAYNDAKRNLGYTKVKSPVDGKVGIIDVTVGNFVSSMSGPLTTINSSNPMYVTFPLDSKSFTQLARIDKNANQIREVDFIFNTGQKYELRGVQDFHDNKIDESTGTITLRATFPNPNGELIHGDFGRIVIYSKLKDDVPVVPQSATLENLEGRFVYGLDENGLPKIVYIKTSGQTDDGMWIVSEGLNAGDKIITSGLQKVIPGQKIRIVQNQIIEDKKVVQPSLFDSLINWIKGFFSNK